MKIKKKQRLGFSPKPTALESWPQPSLRDWSRSMKSGVADGRRIKPKARKTSVYGVGGVSSSRLFSRFSSDFRRLSRTRQVLKFYTSEILF